MIKRFEALARSPVGRALAATAGLVCLGFLVRQAGPELVWEALNRAKTLFPAVVFLEAAVAASELTGLYLLYGEDRTRLPRAQVVRSGFICYAIMSVVPFGRAVAEATRAAMLSRWVGGAKAAAAATRMQAIALLGNACVSIPCLIGALVLLGPTWLPLAIAGNFVVTAALGMGVLAAGRYAGVGAWVGRKFRRAEHWGTDFDRHLRGEDFIPMGGVACVFLGRCFQTLQRMVLLFAVGGGFGFLRGLTAEGIHLVSGAIGDLIPGQLGVTEATYSLSSRALGVTAADGLVMALMAHIAQLLWLGVGALVPLLWPPPKQAA